MQLRFWTFLVLWLAAVHVCAADDLGTLQHAWAQANYQTGEDQKVDALSAVADRVRAATEANPADAELLIWKGIIVSTLAGAKGGLGALGLAKEARASLEQALQINAQALDGSAYTSLGSLYHNVPGWPIGFGSDKKAREHLAKALAINPDGIDSNYFMAEFLLDEGEYQAAKDHLDRASRAPARPGRAIADAGRHQEIAAMMARLDAKLGG